MQAAIDGNAFVPKPFGDANTVQTNHNNQGMIESAKRKACKFGAG